MTPRVSVVIPVKNRAHLLPATLDNVLAQTLPPYEVIVIDDGSTDDIGTVRDRYRGRVLFLENEGTGPGAGRNTGIRRATGDYIQFFDSDDLMTRNKLALQAAALRSGPARMAYGPYVMAEETAGGAWERRDVVMQFKPLPPGPLSRWVLRGWCSITQACLFSRDLIEEVGPWREDLMTHEDKEYLYRIGKCEPAPVHVPGGVVIYRQHGQQVTDQDTVKRMKSLNGIKADLLIKKQLDGAADWYTERIWNGRLTQQIQHLSRGENETLGEQPLDQPEVGGVMDEWFFRIHNRYERFLTRSNWERMHGVSNAPGLFESVVDQAYA
ncbi:MAG: glycosyltransferase [Catalinimonas sp.]